MSFLSSRLKCYLSPLIWSFTLIHLYMEFCLCVYLTWPSTCSFSLRSSYSPSLLEIISRDPTHSVSYVGSFSVSSPHLLLLFRISLSLSLSVLHFDWFLQFCLTKSLINFFPAYCLSHCGRLLFQNYIFFSRFWNWSVLVIDQWIRIDLDSWVPFFCFVTPCSYLQLLSLFFFFNFLRILNRHY